MRFFLLLFILLSGNSVWAIELNEIQTTQIFLEKNLEIIASRYEIEISRAQEITAGLWANPILFLDSQLNPFGQNWNQKNAGGPTQQDLILTLPLDVNGKRHQAVKVARLATDVTEAQFLAGVREGLYTTLDHLYRLQRLKREQELLMEKGQLMDRLVMTLEKRLGSSTNQPLVQGRAKLASEAIKVEIENNKIDQTMEENEIKTALHLPGSEMILANASFKTDVSEIFDVKSLVKYAKETRPDFLAMGIMKKQVSQQIELDQKRIWDDVSLQFGMSRQNRVGARPDNQGAGALPSAYSWMVGVLIPLPTFDRNQGQILQSKIRSNQIAVRENFMELSLKRDIESSVRKIQITNGNLHRYKTGLLNNAKTVRDTALRQFGTGASTLLEYLDAVDAYHSAIQAYITAQYELSSEYLKLKLISGQEIRP